MPAKRPPTTREIAAACGCSQAAVSFALRNDANVSKERRARIQEIARSMGWKPNPIASAYMAHYRSTKPPRYRAALAYLNSNGLSGAINDLPSYQRRFYEGAKARATELGYSLESIWLHETGLTSARLLRILRSQGILGLVIPSFIKPTDILSTFDWSHFAAATSAYTLMDPPLDRVAVHVIHGTHLVLRKVLELGYRKIAVMFSLNLDKRTDHGLLYPIYFEQKQRQGRSIKFHAYSFPITTAVRRGMRAWIERIKPEIVIGESFALDLLQEMKWKIPDRIAYATLDWAPELRGCGGLLQPHELRGALTVDLVSAQLLHNFRGIPPAPKLVLVEPSWKDGASVPPRR